MGTEKVDKRSEFLRFKDIWTIESEHRVEQTISKWNDKALEQEEVLKSKNGEIRSTLRARDMCDFLRREGAINPSYRVLDIGSGAGSFAIEIAMYVRSVKGIDFSPQMCNLSEKRAQEKEVKNAKFEVCDFNKKSASELTKNGKYDLVCSSITPAIRKFESFEKMMSLSSEYCFNASFVYKENQLYLEILRDVFGLPMENGYDGHWHSFYAMFNMLFLEGYYPITGYFDEHKKIEMDVSEIGIEKITKNVLSLIYTRPKNAMLKIKEYIYERCGNDKTIKTSDMIRYGAILWNVSGRTAR